MVRAALRTAVVAVLVLLAVFPLVALFGSFLWNRGTDAVAVRLRALPAAAADPALSPAIADGEIALLPAPVARYLRAVIPAGSRPVTEARFRWEGELLASPGGKKWRAFEAEQLCRVAPAGFVWNAAMSVLPGVGIFARDSFAGGEGSLEVTVMGIHSLLDVHGTPEMAAASLQRHLAEAVWFPTALLPRCGVRWEPIDGNRARATLSSGGATASLEFRFGADGLVESVHAPARYRLVDGGAVPTPWEGRFRGYVVRDGFRVPASVEAAWILPDGPAPYLKGKVKEAAYER
jgi:hypothetical protein